MKREAILHIPMSAYAHGVDERRLVFRLRAARGDLTACTLYYGDTGCRVTPMDFYPAPMEVAARDEYFVYFEVILDSPYHRVFYYFELCDGCETILYYGDVFTDHLVDDRSEYFKLPFNHRADIAVTPDWCRDAVVYNIFPDSFATSRRYLSGEAVEKELMGRTVKGKLGGTIRGIRENAGYLEELGINCIYINPIFAAGEYHKYDLLDYYQIDPCFGNNEEFRAMVEELHRRGIRVIIDGVFNHCGWYFFAFDDVVRNGENSRYRDWFYRLSFPVERPEDPEAYPGYECFGYERMMPKLNTANPEVQDYFCDVCRYWLREYDIDGWRLDVASEINDAFWRAFRRAAKEVKPDCLLIGEVWETASHWLDGSQFDSSMNYDFRKHCRRFFAEGSLDARAFDGRVTGMLMRYRRNILPAQLNILDSHDVSRFYSLCGEDKRKYRLAVLFQLCFVGMPSIFYGDELGVSGILESEYRSPMPWSGGDEELCAFFRRAIGLRRDHIALRRGEYRALSAERDSSLYVFGRVHESETVIVAINAGEKEETFAIPEGAELLWQEGLANRESGTGRNAAGREAALEGFGFAVLVKEGAV